MKKILLESTSSRWLQFSVDSAARGKTGPAGIGVVLRGIALFFRFSSRFSRSLVKWSVSYLTSNQIL